MTAYRVLVTGSREWSNPLLVYDALAAERAVAHEQGYTRFVVVHGACPAGADKYAAIWARFPDVFADMPVIEEAHPADWRPDGVLDKAAGFRRNAVMVALGANVCVAFYQPGAGNKGTDHCAKLAGKAGILVIKVTGTGAVRGEGRPSLRPAKARDLPHA